jgi:hypothetical protein
LPVRVPSKVVASSADKLTQLHDIREQIMGAYEEVKLKGHRSFSFAIVHTSLLTSHSMLKAGTLGGVTFSIYESIIQSAEGKIICPRMEHSTDFLKLVVVPSAFSGFAGCLSGASHGILSTWWDRAVHLIPPLRNQGFATHPVFPLSSALSHCLVHGSLFGLYEGTKRATMYSIGLSHAGEDISRIEGGMCIVFAGLFAGLVSDAIGIVTAPIEQVGWREGRPKAKEAFKTLPFLSLPRRSYLLKSIAPTMLGFVAYEYAKESALQ